MFVGQLRKYKFNEILPFLCLNGNIFIFMSAFIQLSFFKHYF